MTFQTLPHRDGAMTTHIEQNMKRVISDELVHELLSGNVDPTSVNNA